MSTSRKKEKEEEKRARVAAIDRMCIALIIAIFTFWAFAILFISELSEAATNIVMAIVGATISGATLIWQFFFRKRGKR